MSFVQSKPEPALPLPATLKARAKMAAAHQGKKCGPHSAETRAKIAASNTGKPGTFTGKSHTAETRARIAAARRGSGHPWSEARRTAAEQRKRSE